jgi:hypothetical protein
MQRTKPRRRLKVVQANVDPPARSIVSAPPEEMGKFIADGLDLLQKIRQRAQRSERNQEPGGDEAA